MIRVDIETIIMAAGSIPSIIVLRERSSSDTEKTATRALSIQTGAFEASSISRGISGGEEGRPITHDLFVDTLQKLGVKVARVEISKVDPPVFYATVIIRDAEGREIELDARPSDALALAVRSNTPIYVEDDVMNRAGSISSRSVDDRDSEEEFEKFDTFIKTLSPDDF